MTVNEFNSNIKNFAIILGYLDIALNLETYERVKDKYIKVKTILEEWIIQYNLNKNFDNIAYDQSLQIHNVLDDVKEEILFDKEIGDEKLISNEILIWYEIIIKKINEERGMKNVERWIWPYGRYDEAYQIYKNNVLDLQNEYVKKLVLN